MCIMLAFAAFGGVGTKSEPQISPFIRIVEGYSVPFVDDVRQNASPYWDIGAGVSYDYLSITISARSHFLSSFPDSIFDSERELATEGHATMLVGHVEGKANVWPAQFVAGIDLGMIWFHEFDVRRSSWSRSKVPIIGLGIDFRTAVVDKIALCAGVEYMAAFEGFEVSAKAYNSIQATLGFSYDGAFLE
ncbi:hypothetical protein J7L01_07855 [bacterium]|nr:hypothetical protein [bacterium]